jgi:hypothetical protein
MAIMISITYLIFMQMRAYTNASNQRAIRWFMSWVTFETCGNLLWKARAVETFGIQSTSGSKIKMSSLFFLGSR